MIFREGFQLKKVSDFSYYTRKTAVLALMLIIILGVYFGINLYEKRQDIKATYNHTVISKADEIEDYMQSQYITINYLDEQISLIISLANNGAASKTEAQIDKLFKSMVDYQDGFEEIFVKCNHVTFCYQESKQRRLSTEEEALREQFLWNNVDYQTFINSKLPVVSPITVGLDGNKVIFLAKPLRTAEGQYCGYILNILEMQKIVELLENTPEDFSGYFALLDHKKRVIYYPEQITASALSDTLVPLFKEKEKVSEGTIKYYSSIHNCEQFLKFMTLEPTNWTIWSAAPYFHVFLPLYRNVILSIFVLFMVAFIIFLTRKILLKQFVQPLIELNNVSKELAVGKFSYGFEMPNNIPQEINELCNRFKDMALDLKQAYLLLKRQGGVLEKQAQEYSQELLMKNKEMVALYAVASSVSNKNELTDILNQVFKIIMKVLEIDFVTIYISQRYEAGQESVYTVWRGNYLQKEKATFTECASDFAKIALKEKRMIMIDDLQKQDEQIPFALKWSNFKTLVSIPIYYQNRVLGAITLTSSKPRHFAEKDVAILQTICTQLGIIVSNFHFINVINEKHQTLTAIINSMDEGLVFLDSKGKIMYANPLFFKMFHLEDLDKQKELFIFKLKREISPEIEIVLPYKEMKRNFIKKESFQRGQISVTYQERTKHFLIQGFPVHTCRSFLGYGYIIHDITREKEVDNLKSSVLSTVSHELRSPLTTIYGSAESLLRKDVVWSKEEELEFMEAIVEESKRLRELIDNIMDMSKIEAGVLKLDRHMTDITKVIARVVKRYQLMVPENELIVEILDELPYVFIDERRIEQVLNNLLENAIKYSPMGKAIQIKGEYIKEESRLMVGVIDHGIGIADQDQNAVFGRFYRVENAKAIKVKGSGVGLSIAKGIINNHGGEIWVESELGNGSKFYFTLPINNVEEEIR